jgi:response regulator RpfG family c-di-GMP phosphodiesterase
MPTTKNGQRQSRTLAATGDYVQYTQGHESLPEVVSQRFTQVLEAKASRHFDDAYVVYTPTEAGGGNLLYVTHTTELGRLERQLLELYTQSVSVTFENITLQEDLRETQKELVYTLADAVEARSKETGAHVKRVALGCEILARLCGLSEDQITLIKTASPLHDIGKVAIPDAILHKPSKLSPAEWELMQKHAQFGSDILKNSNRPLMQAGAEIAIAHHERWDGKGYPRGIAGDAIPIFGRITALIDVFDALGSRRSYKEPWSKQDIVELIQNERGKQFDPKLVDLLLGHINLFTDLREQHPDIPESGHAPEA